MSLPFFILLMFRFYLFTSLSAWNKRTYNIAELLIVVRQGRSTTDDGPGPVEGDVPRDDAQEGDGGFLTKRFLILTQTTKNVKMTTTISNRTNT